MMKPALGQASPGQNYWMYYFPFIQERCWMGFMGHLCSNSIATFAELLIKLCIVLYSFLAFGGSSQGAQIESLGKWIVLTGAVENGDFDKFVKIIEHRLSDHSGRRVPITGMALYSRGGAALESIKIGRAVRKLRLRTTGPTSEFGNRTLVYCPPGLDGSESQTYFDTKTGDGSDGCACDSACALIWSAGILRNGRVGFHRPHFAEVGIEKFDTFEANGRQARLLVERYMSDMDLPGHVITATVTTSRNDLFYVDARQGYARTPVFDDLTASECSGIGDIHAIESKMRELEDEKHGHAKDEDEISRIVGQYGEFAACHVEVQERLAAKAFTEIRTSVAELKLDNPMISKEELADHIKTYLVSTKH